MKSVLKHLQFLENTAKFLRSVFRECGYIKTNVSEIFRAISPKQL